MRMDGYQECLKCRGKVVWLCRWFCVYNLGFGFVEIVEMYLILFALLLSGSLLNSKRYLPFYIVVFVLVQYLIHYHTLSPFFHGMDYAYLAFIVIFLYVQCALPAYT